MIRPDFGKLAHGTAFGLAILVAAYSALWATACLRDPWPLEFREGAALTTTDLLLTGENPFAVAHQPSRLNVYGIGYPIAVLPFAWLLGNTFFAHRLASLLFLTVAAGLFALLLRTDGASIPAAALGSLFLFSVLVQDLSISARPDGLAFLLMLGALAAAHISQYRPLGLALCGLLSIAGFFTKPYVVVVAPLVGLYLFLFVSKSRAIAFATATGVALVVACELADRRLDCYFTNTFFVHRNFSKLLGLHLASVASNYAVEVFGLLAAAAVLVVGAARTMAHVPAARSKMVDLSANGPALRRALAPPVLYALGAGFALVAVLGGHPGNGLLYWHQLLTPMLLWVVLRRTTPVPLVALARSAVAANLALLLLQSPPLPPDHSEAWAPLDALMASGKRILAPGPLAALALSRGAPVYDNGQTEYADWGGKGNLSRSGAACMEATARFRSEIASQLERRAFDYVILLPGYGPSPTNALGAPLATPEGLHGLYRPAGKLGLPMTFNGLVVAQVWIPTESGVAEPLAAPSP